ncbi:MHJ_0274 family protein [Mycoplasma hafezii]|uniref:MHJ_0274 family protein n=1 Tax=Mycoplasma hafezii TaxID=525886 RepID=UPI003CF5DCA2
MLENTTNLLEEQTSSSSDFSANGSIIIWIVLGVLVLIIVVFFVYSWIKEKVDKKKIAQATQELKKETAIYWYELSTKLLALMDLNTEEQKNFKPSIGEHKMSELNLAAKRTLEKEIKSDRFQSCFRDTEQHIAFVKTVFELKDTNSNLWDKKLPLDREYFASCIENAKKEVEEFQKTDYFDLKPTEDLANEIKGVYYEELQK